MPEQIHPDLSNPAMLYALRDEAIDISRQIDKSELSIAYEDLGHTAGYIAAYLEMRSLEILLEEERGKNRDLMEMLRQARAAILKEELEEQKGKGDGS